MFRLASAGILALTVALSAGAAFGQDKPAVTGVGNQFGEPDPSASSGDDGSGLITGNSLDAILASLERNGLKAELSTDSDGDPRIRSTDENNPFSILFYSCEDGKDCKVIQFSAGWNMKNGIPLARIEEWNASKLWGQAYRDEDKDPWLAMTVNLKGGVTVENFDDTVDWWRVVSNDFERHIEWDKN